MTPQDPSTGLDLPAVTVHAEKRYLTGFPLLLAVTLDNPAAGARLFALPQLDLFFGGGPIGLDLKPVRGGAPLSFPPGELLETDDRITMEPGERRQMLLDLSNFGIDLQPGTYYLTLTLKVARYTTTSQPIEVEFVQPLPFDAQEASRLRKLANAPTDTGAWGPFLRNNWNTVAVSPGLSPEAHRQLALHIFLHYAFYGPQPVGSLDASLIRQQTSPVLRGEAALLESEVRAASGLLPAPGIPPELQFRLAAIRQGKGFLTKFRRTVGRERQQLRPLTAYPYQ